MNKGSNKEYVIAVDIGSPLNESHFGWADSEGNNGITVATLKKAIEGKTFFSMGIEAPLFIPLSGELDDFTRARKFDGNRSWSVAAGAYTATINLGFLARVLTLFVNKGIAVTTDREIWKAQNENCILIWEAFISRNESIASEEENCSAGASTDDNRSGNIHIKDAQTALNSYQSTITIDTKDYLSLPLAIANYVGLKTLVGKTGVVVVGNKGLLK